jgi:hypothetical protein
MSNALYRVECVDRETGKSAFQVLAAAGPDEAADLANRKGFLVGKVERVAEPEAFKRGRRWPWVVLGAALGVALTVGAAFVAFYILNNRRSLIDDKPTATSALTPSDASRSAKPTWETVWPALPFPPRPVIVPESVEVHYDEFRNYTSIKTDLELQSCSITVLTTEEGKVNRLTEPPDRVLVSVYESERAMQGELIFLVDGRRIAPRLIGTEYQVANYELKTEDLLAIINAKSVRGRAEFSEFVLTKGDVTALRDFASMLRP